LPSDYGLSHQKNQKAEAVLLCRKIHTGRPRIVWQKRLGALDAVVKRADSAQPIYPKQAVLFEAGGVGALLRIAQRLGLFELINDIVPIVKRLWRFPKSAFSSQHFWDHMDRVNSDTIMEIEEKLVALIRRHFG
jgi:hypothetical protein